MSEETNTVLSRFAAESAQLLALGFDWHGSDSSGSWVQTREAGDWFVTWEYFRGSRPWRLVKNHGPGRARYFGSFASLVTAIAKGK